MFCQKKIIIRVDGHQSIGLGHISRCLALADMLKDHFRITFACQKRDENVLNMVRNEGTELIELSIENDYEKDAENLKEYLNKNTILVLDGYNFREAYQLLVKPHSFKLVCIDDIHSCHFYADVIINHSEHAKYVKYSCEPYTRLYLGGEYALLRKPFLEHAGFERNFEKVENILVCMGGADPGNQTLRILQSLDLTKLNLAVNVIIGIANPNYGKIFQWIGENKDSKLRINLLSNLSASEMCEQFMQNDFLFTPGSTTAWEACCIGIPMIVGLIADNQMGMAQILGERQAALNVGWYRENHIEKIKDNFVQLTTDKDNLKKFVCHQKKIVDGKSELRYKKLFCELQR
jgi:UDP-2,4-diacetamido-2,4,6-trideoxy-beta-L-altropyranose hydrolase